MKDLKGVSGCKQILRFAQDDTIGWGFAQDDTIGKGLGRLVSWSVFMHALVWIVVS